MTVIHPGESQAWVEGDRLRFDEPSDSYDCLLRFVRLDPDDPRGFYAEYLGPWPTGVGDVSGGWTRTRFVCERTQ